jgi:hypothetical protein
MVGGSSMEGYDEDSMIFEEIREAGNRRRIGRLRTTGVKVLESIKTEDGRETERLVFRDTGEFKKRIIYEYDQERRPRLITAFDRQGEMIFRQERGKRPELFEE